MLITIFLGVESALDSSGLFRVDLMSRPLTRRLRHDSLLEIGTQFQIKKYSSVSSIVERMKDRIGTDRKVKKRIDELCALIKSQEQT